MTRDLRRYTRQTIFYLVLGGILLLLFLGDGLIYLIYGGNAALFGVLCILAGLAPVVLIILVLWIIDWVVKRSNEE
jgi:hypothetical protein